MKTFNCVLAWSLLFLAGTNLWAIQSGFNIQGRLTDANGINKDGTFQIKFSIFDASNVLAWEKNMPAVLVQNGNFQIILQGEGQGQGGTTIQLEEAVKNLEAAYLEIKVGSDPPLVPRQLLLRSPFASADNFSGAVMWFYRVSCPTGFLKADGRVVSQNDYPALGAAMGKTGSFNLPDLRGEFIRGVDDGRGVDQGRVLGSNQLDSFKAHSHVVWTMGTSHTDANGYSGGGWFGDPTYKNSGVTGESETRPRNIALLPCIKY